MLKWNSTLTCGTLTGTTLGLLPNLPWDDVARTAVLACIGAVVSGGVSWLFDQCFNKHK